MAMTLARPRFTRLIAPTLSRRANASAKWLFRTPRVSANSAAIFVQGFCCKVCADHNRWCRAVPIEPHFVAAGDFATALPLHIRMPSAGVSGSGSRSGSGLGCGICCRARSISWSRSRLENLSTQRARSGFCSRHFASRTGFSTMARAACHLLVMRRTSSFSSAALPCQVAASCFWSRVLSAKTS